MKFNILDRTGHTEMEFDTATKKGVSEAMKMFADLTKEQRKVAAVRTAAGEQRHVRSFDPNAQDYYFHDMLVGG